MEHRRRRATSQWLMRLTAALAHDLRNPLNAATLQIETIVRKAVSDSLPSTVRDGLTAAHLELRRLSDIVDDYLSLTEPLRLQRGPVVIREVVDKAMHRLTATIPCSAYVVRNDVPTDLPAVDGDAARLERVFFHLLKNGIEAVEGEADALVWVDAKAGTRALTVYVRDNGSGIPEQARESVFSPFFTTKASNLGLGLTLVRALMAAHGGQVHIPSDQPRTSVELTLPFQPPGDTPKF